MAEKFAIYFGEPLATATAGYEDQRSARVNVIVHEWLQIVADNVPQLLPSEWEILLAATTSTAISEDKTLKLLWAVIADSGHICAGTGVDADALAGKLRALTLTQRYALRETLERTWVAIAGGEDVQVALRLAGAVAG